ncbi:outer membrane lipoprotein carrier protein LolA [Thermodesulfobacteriota bacterium]
MKKIIRSIIAAWIIVLSLAANAHVDDLTIVLTRLEKNMMEVNSIETTFQQIKKLAIFKQNIEINGKVYMQKPGKFAWHVFKPIKYSMVMNGSQMRQWDEETGTIQKVSLKKNPAFQAAFGQMRLWLSSSYLSMRSEYEIELRDEKPLVLEFVPLQNNLARNYIQSVTVTFREDERYIQSIAIVEIGGDSTLLNFLDIRLNHAIPDSAWRMGSAPDPLKQNGDQPDHLIQHRSDSPSYVLHETPVGCGD